MVSIMLALKLVMASPHFLGRQGVQVSAGFGMLLPQSTGKVCHWRSSHVSSVASPTSRLIAAEIPRWRPYGISYSVRSWCGLLPLSAFLHRLGCPRIQSHSFSSRSTSGDEQKNKMSEYLAIDLTIHKRIVNLP